VTLASSHLPEQLQIIAELNGLLEALILLAAPQGFESGEER
jgi:hypothetical protein